MQLIVTLGNETGNICVPFNSIRLYPKNPYNDANLIISCVLMVLGLVGNSLGIYASKSNPPSSIRAVSPVAGGFTTCNSKSNRPQQQHTTTPSKKKRVDVVQKNKLIQSSHSTYLIKCFFGVNLFNSAFLLSSPILEIYGGRTGNPMWNDRHWIIYLTHFDYPFSKAMIATGIMIYILYSLNQYVAVIYPYNYKNLVTRRRIVRAIWLSFVYCAIWCIPISLWFQVTRAYVCRDDLEPRYQGIDKDVYEKFYLEDTNHTEVDTSGVWLYGYKVRRRQGMRESLYRLYEVMRELFVIIIPFSLILICKFSVIRRNKKVADTALFTPHITSTAAATPVIATEVARQPNQLEFEGLNSTLRKVTTPAADIDHIITETSNNADDELKDTNDHQKQLYLKPENNSPQKIDRKCSTLTISPVSAATSSHTSRTKKRELVNRQQAQTFIILTAEFIILIFPISIMQMINWSKLPLHSTVIGTIYLFLSTLEYIYVTCTFYFNAAFNREYRRSAREIFKCNV